MDKTNFFYVDKVICKLTGEKLYFLGNVLVGIRVVFLPDCLLIFSLLKHRGVGNGGSKNFI